MIILSAQHIAKSFGVNAVLRDVSLTVQQGDRIGLVGVNGCGKSTLMRILAGLDAQDGGEISLVRLPARRLSGAAEHGDQRRNRLERAAKGV